MQQAARAIKREVPDAILMGDVCLCEYMSHGHCGIVKAAPQSLGAAVATPPAATTEYEIVNDATLELLARTSVSLAQAGIDIIAPSDMMDGRVGAIRKGLDRGRLREYAHPFLCGQVCFRILRSFPRGGRFRARSSAIAAPIRWMAPTSAKPCAKLNSTSKKART